MPLFELNKPSGLRNINQRLGSPTETTQDLKGQQEAMYAEEDAETEPDDDAVLERREVGIPFLTDGICKISHDDPESSEQTKRVRIWDREQLTAEPRFTVVSRTTMFG